MKPVIIFGAGSLAQMASFYLKEQGVEVRAFVIDSGIKSTAPKLDGKDIVTADQLKTFSPREFDAFVAIGYSQNNKNREAKISFLKKMNYQLISIRSSQATVQSELTENSFVMAQAIIEPFVKMGIGNIFWSGSQVCHHSTLGDYNFFGPKALVCGDVTMGSHNFIGGHSTIRDGIRVGDSTVVGAHTLILEDLESRTVTTTKGTLPFRKDK
jgi:sugar O-acyltransferase (sialic acid O-acetyltransferase NeuD family)